MALTRAESCRYLEGKVMVQDKTLGHIEAYELLIENSTFHVQVEITTIDGTMINGYVNPNARPVQSGCLGLIARNVTKDPHRVSVIVTQISDWKELDENLDFWTLDYTQIKRISVISLVWESHFRLMPYGDQTHNLCPYVLDSLQFLILSSAMDEFATTEGSSYPNCWIIPEGDIPSQEIVLLSMDDWQEVCRIGATYSDVSQYNWVIESLEIDIHHGVSLSFMITDGDDNIPQPTYVKAEV